MFKGSWSLENEQRKRYREIKFEVCEENIGVHVRKHSQQSGVGGLSIFWMYDVNIPKIMLSIYFRYCRILTVIH
jgi:hypothetical protein